MAASLGLMESLPATFIGHICPHEPRNHAYLFPTQNFLRLFSRKRGSLAFNFKLNLLINLSLTLSPKECKYNEIGIYLLLKYFPLA
jgi:hypothetical protein